MQTYYVNSFSSSYILIYVSHQLSTTIYSSQKKKKKKKQEKKRRAKTDLNGLARFGAPRVAYLIRDVISTGLQGIWSGIGKKGRHINGGTSSLPLSKLFPSLISTKPHSKP
jgi:hypothetical protein